RGSVRQILDQLYDRVTLGGFVFIDGYPEVDAEVKAFLDERGVDDQLERVDWSAAAWRQTEDRPASAGATATAATAPVRTPPRRSPGRWAAPPSSCRWSSSSTT